jgi:hypothetical protein
MALSKFRFLVLGATFALAGCSFASEALFPSLDGDAPAETVGIQPSQGELGGDPTVSGPPALGRTDFQAPGITPGQPTGTFVGQKVQTFRGELRQLQAAITQRNQTLQQIRNQTVQDSQSYHETVGAINARLQVGTTPGNPVLQQRWSSAQQRLDAINQDIASMNQLATQIASDSAMAAYLLESVRAAFGLSGAVEEDHRQLRILEDETNQTTVLIERLLSELSQDISRQQSYVANERGNLNTLALGIKNGQLYGTSLGNQAIMRGGMAGFHSEGLPTINTMGRRPLVVIRFDRPNVAYEQALYQAMSRATERRPNAAFDLVAVAPQQGNVGERALGVSSARRAAEQVLRSLTEMGLPSDRIQMSAMTGANASSPEVHLYVR